jgi:hypothetical protein
MRYDIRNVIRVTRIDAAYRQLRMAIALYFQQADPVCVHALASASREVLRIINDGSKEPMLRDVHLVPIERRPTSNAGKEKFHRKIKEFWAFSKHGSKDPNAAMNFDPNVNNILLLECVFKHEEITGSSFDLGTVFQCYIALGFPGSFHDAVTQQIRQLLNYDGPMNLPPKQFFALYGKTIVVLREKFPKLPFAP